MTFIVDEKRKKAYQETVFTINGEKVLFNLVEYFNAVPFDLIIIAVKGTALEEAIKEIKKYVDKNTFIYMDPPYRPLNATSNFNEYSKEPFNDDAQRRLSKFFNELNEIGAKIMKSNSDPKNTDENDEFFDELYSNYNISRISASRSINSKGTGRGKVSEILITNY